MFLKCENNIIAKTGSKFCLNIIIKGVLGGAETPPSSRTEARMRK